MARVTTQARTFNWVNKPAAEKVPAGVRHATFYSAINKTEVGYCIYLPPDYDTAKGAEARYPVVYCLHGGLVGSETLAIGEAIPVDAAIRAGEIPPRICVFPNGGRISHYDYPSLHTYGETALVRELIPHVDNTYRTMTHADARGLQGFSAGGRGTARIMFKYPELFSSAVPMAGGYQHEKFIQQNNGRSQMPPDCVFERGNNTYDLARDYAVRKKHRLRILIVVGTEDPNYMGNLDWMRHLDSLGVEYRRMVVEGVGHNFLGIYRRVGLDIMKFHAQA